ncbi:MAG: hypothetical protein HY816_17755 [Candidatus Wallbacteria bacterium]|nr:hypothetical protein [Candidatus Wallbacteria bacterium]
MRASVSAGTAGGSRVEEWVYYSGHRKGVSISMGACGSWVPALPGVLAWAVAAAVSCGPALAAAGEAAWVVELDSGRLLAVEGAAGADRPGPPGSLLKVFLFLHAADRSELAKGALAVCGASSARKPALDACWYHPGHGTVGFAAGLALSCQQFANGLADRVDPEELRSLWRQLGLQIGAGRGPPARSKAWRAQATGHDSSIRSKPLELLAALAACVNGGYLFRMDRSAPVLVRRLRWRPDAVEAVLAGLGRTAIEGTARGAGLAGCLAKTGTAPALDPYGRVDLRRTQGWAFACTTSGGRRIAVLACAEPGTGADAAVLAGRVLRSQGAVLR